MSTLFDLRDEEKAMRMFEIQNSLFANEKLRVGFMRLTSNLKEYEDREFLSELMIYCYLAGVDNERSKEADQ